MSAMSKYPFIVINNEKVNFESLLVGKVAQNSVTVKNSSLVATNIRIEKISDDDKDHSFSLSLHEAHLAPQGEAKITISYTPTVAGNISCQYYRIVSDGGNELSLSVRGEAEGYAVDLSANSVHFGEVAKDSSTNRLINVQNNNDVPATFQFITDKNNLFSFS